MKKRGTPALILTLLLIFYGTVAQGNSVQDTAALEAFFDGVLSVQLAQGNVPGAEIVVVADGQILLAKGYGYADLERKAPMEPGLTLHRPGSISKILVWLAVMQLAEQGRLNLYTDINSYLDFTIPARLAGGREVPPITLHHLLTHTAGFEDEVAGTVVSQPELLRPLGAYVKEGLPARVFTPGSVMAYSNYGTALAAYIVERVSGQPFSAYVEEHIFAPLGMTSSTFAQRLSSDLAGRLSPGYRWEQGKFVPGTFEYVQNFPAAGLTSSSLDIAKVLLALLNLGALPAQVSSPEETDEEGEIPLTRLLSEDTARTMQSQQYAAHPELPGMTYGLMEWEYNGYRILGHVGDTFLFSTGLYFLPEANVGLYVVYNSPVGGGLRSALLKGFLDRYFPSTAQASNPRPITPGTGASYEGYYFSSRVNFTGIETAARFAQPLKVVVDTDGYLLLQAGGETSRFGEVAPGLFQEVNGGTKIAFAFQDGKAMRILVPGPHAWLRAKWYQTPVFFGSLLGGSALFMLVTLCGWARALFWDRSRKKPFFAPKALAVLFVLLFFTTIVVGIELVTTVHPAFNVPLLVLEPSSTLKLLRVLAKVLMGLSTLILITALYLVAARKGTLWQRIHYALFTLSVLGVNLVLWQLNL